MFSFREFIEEDWHEWLHPREPKGGSNGGRFSNKYIHYSNKKLSVIKKTPNQETGPKPKGLWISIGTEWDDWCKENDYGQYYRKTKIAIVIKRFANTSPLKVIKNITIMVRESIFFIAPPK
jgi:hypothetical protein